MSADNMMVHVRDGHLKRQGGEKIRLPLADYIAQANGFTYVERMVTAKAWMGKSISISQDTLEALSATDECKLCVKGQSNKGGWCSNCGGSGKVPL